MNSILMALTMESDVIKNKISELDSPLPSDVQCISQIKLTEGKSFEEGDLNVVQLNKSFERKIVNILLPITFNIYFGCSKEPSH